MAAAAVVVPARPAAATETLALTPVADTYVSAEFPTTTYGTSLHMTVDAQPVRKAYLRFNVSGTTGRPITGVHLRLYQIDDTAPVGGQVYSITSNTWPEALTWDARPATDGPLLGQFPAVAANTWYDLDLGPGAVTGDGLVSFAIETPDADGARWATRESTTQPQLVIDMADAPPPPPPTNDDGLTTVAGPTAGSSDPTFFANEHHLAKTAAGRILTVHGIHAVGIQLAWHDYQAGWRTTTTGSVTDGVLLSGTGTGDWPASVVVVRGKDGKDHGWAMWGGTAGWGETPRPIDMRHLSNLDSPSGPTVGPAVRVAAPGVAGNGRADIGFETLSDGTVRGFVTWVKRLSTQDSTSDQMVQSFTGVETNAPKLGKPVNLFTSESQRVATLVPDVKGRGIRLMLRRATNGMAVYRHNPKSADGGWSAGAEGAVVPPSSRLTATGLASGETLAVVESDVTNHVVIAQRFGADGSPRPVELQLNGYREPNIASTAGGAVLVAIRQSDGFVVSRTLTSSSWSTADRVELGAEGGGNYQWPNALRESTGMLRFVVRGPSGGPNRSAVLSVARTL
jgi:hypothetical protein